MEKLITGLDLKSPGSAKRFGLTLAGIGYVASLTDVPSLYRGLMVVALILGTVVGGNLKQRN